MSYDISIADQSFNITYNISSMFYNHNKKGIRFIYEKTGNEALPLLIDMLSYFLYHKKTLEQLNPANNWGSYENTAKCLLKMSLASATYPHDLWSGD